MYSEYEYILFFIFLCSWHRKNLRINRSPHLSLRPGSSSLRGPRSWPSLFSPGVRPTSAAALQFVDNGVHRQYEYEYDLQTAHTYAYYQLFFSSLPFSIAIWTSFVLSCRSCGYYALSSGSVSAATRLAYGMYLIPTLILPFFLFLSEVYDLFLCIVYYLLFYLFSS